MKEILYTKADSAIVSSNAKIGKGTIINSDANIGDGVVIGENCIIGSEAFIASGVRIESGVKIGYKTAIWYYSHIRKNADIGSECKIGGNVFVDLGVPIGNRVKIQNNSLIYHGVDIEEGVFIGPNVIFTNDLRPRAIDFEGKLLSDVGWTAVPTFVKKGASIGARSAILCGTTLGNYCMVGLGSVVTNDVPGMTNKYDVARRSLLDSLKNHPCMDCKQLYPPYVLDWDHRPDETKLFNIAQERNRNLVSLLNEISKCDLVCSNCHRIRTFSRRKYKAE